MTKTAIDTLFTPKAKDLTDGLFKGKTKVENGVDKTTLGLFCNIGNEPNTYTESSGLLDHFIFRLAGCLRTTILVDTISVRYLRITPGTQRRKGQKLYPM